MPDLNHSVPGSSRTQLIRRQRRAQRVQLYVQSVEPAAIVFNLRKQRMYLFDRFTKECKANGDVKDICDLNAGLIKAQDLLLRLAKIPQAPAGVSGKKLLEEARKLVEAEPIDAVDVREPAGE